MADAPNLAPADEWQEAAEAGEAAVRAPLAQACLNYCDAPYHRQTHMAVFFGAAREVAAVALAACAPEGASILEEYLVAYIRSGMRGVDGPIHDDGRPFTGVHHG